MNEREVKLWRIELEDAEHIVRHGSTEIVWFVRVSGRWVSAAELPGAEVQRNEAGPGTVWRRLVALRLPSGTRLMRVESAPRRIQGTPLDFLVRGQASSRRVRRCEYEVAEPGVLKALTGPLGQRGGSSRN